MWFFMEALARFFSPDQAVQEQIVSYLFYNILSTPFTVGSMIFNGVMTGAGATLYTLVVNTSCIWLVRLPWPGCWRISCGGSRGVYTAMLISMIVQASAMLWVFFRKDWPGYAMRRSAFRQPVNEFFIESFREHSAIGSICRSEPNVPARSFHARSESRSFDSGNILKPKGSDAIPAVLLTCPLLFSGGEFEY